MNHKKIVIFTNWNCLDGIYIHAKLISDIYKNLNYQVKIFSPFEYIDKYSFRFIKTKDEENIKKVFSFFRSGEKYTEEQILSLGTVIDLKDQDLDCDYIILEKPTSTPLKTLIPFFKRSRAKKIFIIHEGTKILNPYFYQCPCDKLIVFEKNFVDIFKNNSQLINKTKIIPFPCYLVKEKISPIKFDDKIIKILIFTRYDITNQIKILIKKLKQQKVNYCFEIYTSLIEIFQKLSFVKKITNFKITLSREHFDNKKFHNTLFSFNFLLFVHPNEEKRKVISSLFYNFVSFKRPILVPNNNFFQEINKEAIKYNNIEDIFILTKKFISDKKNQQVWEKSVDKFIEKHHPKKIALEIIN